MGHQPRCGHISVRSIRTIISWVEVRASPRRKVGPELAANQPQPSTHSGLGDKLQEPPQQLQKPHIHFILCPHATLCSVHRSHSCQRPKAAPCPEEPLLFSFSTLLSAPVAVQPLWFGNCSAITAESWRAVGRIAEGSSGSSPAPGTFQGAPTSSVAPTTRGVPPTHPCSVQRLCWDPHPWSQKSLENMTWMNSEDAGHEQPNISAKSPKTQEVEETNSARAWQSRAAQLSEQPKTSLKANPSSAQPHRVQDQPFAPWVKAGQVGEPR